MKVCFKCGAEKPLTEFYKHSGMADGHLNKCKDCTKSDVSKNREENLEYYKEYDRNRPNHEERLAVRNEKLREKYSEDAAFRERRTQTLAETRQKHPGHYAARCAVNNAIRDGLLIKPSTCEHCGGEFVVISGHHWSYEPENWLDVIWLCSRCHGREHARLNKLNREED